MFRFNLTILMLLFVSNIGFSQEDSSEESSDSATVKAMRYVCAAEIISKVKPPDMIRDSVSADPVYNQKEVVGKFYEPKKSVLKLLKIEVKFLMDNLSAPVVSSKASYFCKSEIFTIEK